MGGDGDEEEKEKELVVKQSKAGTDYHKMQGHGFVTRVPYKLGAGQWYTKPQASSLQDREAEKTGKSGLLRRRNIAFTFDAR